MLKTTENYFHFEKRKTGWWQEFRGGTVTFITTAYIIAVAPHILSMSGGTCTADDCTTYAGNPDCMFLEPPDEGYGECVEHIKRGMVSMTAFLCALSTILMGALANMPLVLSCGLGLAPYFTYNIVGFHGAGKVTYETAVTAVFIEGLIFIFLTVIGVRTAIIKLLPRSLLLGITGGIGVFLAHIGLQQSEGLGLVTYNSATLVTLGGCPPEHRVLQYSIPDPTQVCVPNAANVSAPIEPNIGVPSPNYGCMGGVLTSAPMWLGISGIVIIALFMKRNVPGSIMIGILWITFISWIPGHAASYLGAGSPFPGGESRMAYFKKIFELPQLQVTAFKFDFKKAFSSGDVWLALATMLYVDFFDATGTLYAMGNFLGNFLPGFVNEKKEFERMKVAFTIDGVSIVMAGAGGISPITVYGESSAGIKDGARTGVAAIVTAIWFLIAMFFAPVFASMPPFAAGSALIIVGSLMITALVEVDWFNPEKGIPAFITLILMPLTYSIAYGIIGGLVVYIVIKYLNKLITLVFGAPKMSELEKEMEEVYEELDKIPEASVVASERILNIARKSSMFGLGVKSDTEGAKLYDLKEEEDEESAKLVQK